jgi:hypothetical protein
MLGKKFFVRLLSREERTAKFDHGAAMDEIQQPTQAGLKALGFRRQRRIFNRVMPDGLVHVVAFQMGAAPLGGHEISELRPNLYGKFTVELGIVLPRLVELQWAPKPPPRFLSHGHAQLRLRLGALTDGRDTWWTLQPPPNTIGVETWERIRTKGLPFLDRFASHEAIAQFFSEHGKLPGTTDAGAGLTAAAAGLFSGKIEIARNAIATARLFGGDKPVFLARVDQLEQMLPK